MNVSQLISTLFDFSQDARVRVDVGGDVRDITHLTVLHDGEDIVLIVPKDT